MKAQVIHILFPIIAASIVNAYIYLNKWNSQKNNIQNKYLPPGYVIAIVWIIILGLLGQAHYLSFPSYVSITIMLAVIYCITYPFLTSGLQQSKSEIYNILSFIIAIIVLFTVYSKNQEAVIYVIPFVLWTSYVNIVT